MPSDHNFTIKASFISLFPLIAFHKMPIKRVERILRALRAGKTYHTRTFSVRRNP